MINKLVNYYNEQYDEDKVVIWLFTFFEVFTFVLGFILFFMYIILQALASIGPD